jgi:ABC-2 type transport system permease protein
MRIFDITFKDLTQVLRDRQALLFLVAMPVVFTFFMSFAYRGPQPESNEDARLALAWVNQDRAGLLGSTLEAMLSESDSVRLEPMGEAEATEAVRSGKAAGAVIVPADFSALWLKEQDSQVVLITDTASITGQSLYQVLRGPVTRLMSALETARLDVQAIQERKTLSAAEQETEFLAAFQHAHALWSASESASQVQTQLAAASAASDPYGGNPYNQSSPGMLVMFAVFGLVSSAQVLVQERKTRTLDRMITTALTPASIVGGHFLAMFVLTLLQQVLLVGFGQLILGVDYLSAPLGILATMMGLSLCVASIGLLIGVVAKEEQQVILLAMAAMFTFSALGGVWFPLEGAGQAFAAIGRLTPTAWAMTGFQNIILRGLDSTSAVLPAIILLLYAAGFFSLAVWRFRKVV